MEGRLGGAAARLGELCSWEQLYCQPAGNGKEAACPGGVSGGICRPLRGPDPVVDPVHVIGHSGVDAGLVEPPAAIAPADDAVQVGHAVLLTDQGSP